MLRNTKCFRRCTTSSQFKGRRRYSISLSSSSSSSSSSRIRNQHLQRSYDASAEKLITSSIHTTVKRTLLCTQIQSYFFPKYNHEENRNDIIEPQKILACSRSSIATTKTTVSTPSSLLSSKHITKKIINKIKHHVRSLWDAIMVLLRTSEIGIRLSPLLILTPAAILVSSRRIQIENEQIMCSSSSNNNNIISNMAWKYTLYTIQKLGPAFIKISQWASTRRDIFPLHVCDRLSQLNDATFLHSWDHTHQILMDTLGKDYGRVLKIDKRDVIGSGSVAQVYSGFWEEEQEKEEGAENDNGRNEERIRRRVAVKILHPNIQDYIERDLLLMKRAAAMVGKFV